MNSLGPHNASNGDLDAALNTVSAFISDTNFDSLPPPVVARMGLILADCIAAIAAGNQQPDVRALAGRNVAATGATIIGTPHKAEMRNAAMMNGIASSTLEIDEGNRFARGHPGSHVVPSGLAVAEILNSDGREFLTALVLGYEVGARVGAGSRLRDNMQSHGTWGAIAAAVTVGKLRGFSRQQIRTVIDVASCLGLGSNIHAAFEGGSVRNVYAGVGNAMGILAADLVESGYTGGKSSLGIVYGTILSDAFDPAALTKGLGQRWEIERNYFKIHACCRHLHGVADNVLRLRGAHPDLAGRFQEIAAIQVESYSKAAEMIEADPINMTAAKFSAPFVVATTLVHGVAGIDSFGSAALANTDVRALARKVTVRERREMTAQLPNKRPSRVTITMVDGRSLVAEADSHKGDPEDPHDAAALHRKFLDLTEPVWGKDASTVKNLIESLHSGESLRALLDMLSRGSLAQ